MKIRLSFLLVLYFVYLNHGANILLLEEVPSPSHHIWFKIVTTVLAERGHNITVVTRFNDTSTDNVHYIYMDKVYEAYNKKDVDEEFSLLDILGPLISSHFVDGYKFSILICKGFLGSSGWDQLISYPDDYKFDLIIHDYLLGGCLLNFMQKFKNVPLISMTAYSDNILLTSLTKSSVTPALNAHPLMETLPVTFIDRFSNVLKHMVDKIMYHCYVSPKLSRMVRNSNKFNDTTSVSELSRRSILYLINYDPAVDGPQQFPPNVISVGGLQITDSKVLPETIQDIVDNSLDGLVLVSLDERLNEFILGDILQVFGQFPNYKFVWQINREEFRVPIPENVHLQKWIPQSDILAHNNTKFFITHGSHFDIQEATWYGVPMLGLPILTAHMSNIHRSADKGIAEFYDLNDFSSGSFYKKLNSLLTNPKYQENMEINSKAFKDQKETPLERAVWWIEWAIRNPNVSHFKSNGQNLGFLQIESADVFAFLTIILSIFTSIFLWMMFYVVRQFYFKNAAKLPAKLPKTKKKKQK